MDKFDLKKYLTEGKILKENTSEFPEYEEGKTFLERNEFLKTHNRYLLGLSKEEYDFYVENGEDVFFDKYPDATGNFEFVERPKEYMYEESEFKIVIDDEDYIDENKSTNQIKENTTKYPEFKESGSDTVIYLQRESKWDLTKLEYLPIETKEEYDYLLENGVDEYLGEYGINLNDFNVWYRDYDSMQGYDEIHKGEEDDFNIESKGKEYKIK